MFVNSELLRRFLDNRAARRALTAVGGSAVQAQLGALKTQKKAIWDEVHRQYSIPAQTKLKIEMDGALAGELRYKESGAVYGVVNTALAQTPVTAEPSCQQTCQGDFVFIDGDGYAKVVSSLNELSDYFEDHGFDFTLRKLA